MAVATIMTLIQNDHDEENQPNDNIGAGDRMTILVMVITGWTTQQPVSAKRNTAAQVQTA